MPPGAAALLSAAAATAGVTLLSPCAPGTSACYVPVNVSQSCVAVGGAVVEVQTVPYCALPAPATQFQQCGGVSCYTTGQAAFARNCTATLGGFVSGSPTGDGSIPFCITPLFVSVFTACPESAGTCVSSLTDAQFAASCVGLGGFVDAFLNNAGGTLVTPQCVAPATVVSACGGVLSGCAPDANFSAACAGRGGFVPAVADGAPTCALPGSWTVWAPSGLPLLDLGTFATACGSLGGFVGSPGVCLLPCPSGACGAPASVSSASATGTPSPSRPPSASAPVTTTPLPSRSAAGGAGLGGGALALAVALAAVLASASSSTER
jgi:hypothetical protein